MMKIFEYIIIGGGITGLSCARKLQQNGEENFIVLESEKEVGGLCRTKHINGHYLDIGGGHFLHSKYDYVLKWIFSHIPETEFNLYKGNIGIKLEKQDINFPIELNLWQLPKEEQVEYIYSIIMSAKNSKECSNYEEWIKNHLGDKIADNYMIPYNKKLWCIDISKLDTTWLFKIPKTE